MAIVYKPTFDAKGNPDPVVCSKCGKITYPSKEHMDMCSPCEIAAVSAAYREKEDTSSGATITICLTEKEAAALYRAARSWSPWLQYEERMYVGPLHSALDKLSVASSRPFRGYG